jgi:protein-disulfide isomerase
MASREEQKRKLREERQAAQEADAAAAARRKRTAYLAGGIGLIALIVVVALVLVSQSGDDETTVDTKDVFAGVPQKGIALGDADAPVTVVEFADLQCPFCRDFAVHDLPGIVKDYVKPGDVKMELRLLAFIDPTQSADGRNVAAGAAEQDLIWPFAENVYNNQGQEGSGYMTTDFLSEQAAAVPGLDVDKALAAADSTFAQDYATESDDEAEQAGVSSTPSFAVTPQGGETKVVDADGLRGAIDDALDQAKG